MINKQERAFIEREVKAIEDAVKQISDAGGDAQFGTQLRDILHAANHLALTGVRMYAPIELPAEPALPSKN